MKIKSCFWLIGLCASALRGQLGFFPGGYTRAKMNTFGAAIEQQLRSVVDSAVPTRDDSQIWDVEKNMPGKGIANVLGHEKVSGYEKLLCIQAQIEWANDKKRKDIDNRRKLEDQYRTLLESLLFSERLSAKGDPVLTAKNFQSLCAAINDLLDKPLQTLREENSKHRVRQAMIDPLFSVTGIQGYLLCPYIDIATDRQVDDGKLTTPKGFGHLAKVTSLEDENTQNLGYRVLRGIFQSMYGDGWAWAALKVLKEQIIFALGTECVEDVCRYAAVVQFILDQASYRSASSLDYGQGYYAKFYRELALVLTSTCSPVTANLDLNYQYNKLDENTGDEVSKDCKRRMNENLYTAGLLHYVSAQVLEPENSKSQRISRIGSPQRNIENLDDMCQDWKSLSSYMEAPFEELKGIKLEDLTSAERVAVEQDGYNRWWRWNETSRRYERTKSGMDMYYQNREVMSSYDRQSEARWGSVEDVRNILGKGDLPSDKAEGLINQVFVVASKVKWREDGSSRTLSLRKRAAELNSLKEEDAKEERFLVPVTSRPSLFRPVSIYCQNTANCWGRLRVDPRKDVTGEKREVVTGRRAQMMRWRAQESPRFWPIVFFNMYRTPFDGIEWLVDGQPKRLVDDDVIANQETWEKSFVPVS